MSDLRKANEEIAEAVTGGFQKIEDSVVDGYKKIESTVVGAYQSIEDKFVARYLLHEGETVEQAKERLVQEQAALRGAQKVEAENVPQSKRRESRPVSIPAGRNGPPD